MNAHVKVAARAALLIVGIATITWLLRPDPSLLLAVISDPQGVVDAGGADDVFLVIAQVAFAAIACWLMLTIGFVACANFSQRPQVLATSIRIAPPALRGSLAILLGIGAFALTACARTSQPQALPPTTPPAYAASSDSFDWPSAQPTPTPSTPTVPSESAPADAPVPTGSSSPSDAERPTITVHSGDCLWSIAMDELGANAPLADIADYVDALYIANAEAIGADPDLLKPGLALHLPPTSLPTI